jgi:hypothetical protein
MRKSSPKRVKGKWNVEILACCPKCKSLHDIAKQRKFWDKHPMSWGETGLSAKGIKFQCCYCDEKFLVDVVD